jgi:hypothetical protein
MNNFAAGQMGGNAGSLQLRRGEKSGNFPSFLAFF